MKLKNYGLIGMALGFVLAELYSSYIEQLANSCTTDITIGHAITSFGVILISVAGMLYPEFEKEDSPLTADAGMYWSDCFAKYGKNKRQNLIGHSLFSAIGSSLTPFGILYVIMMLLKLSTEWTLVLGISFFTGQIVHLIIDSFIDGVRWFLPICKVGIRIPIIRNLFAEIVATVLITGVLLYIAAMHASGNLL